MKFLSLGSTFMAGFMACAFMLAMFDLDVSMASRVVFIVSSVLFLISGIGSAIFNDAK